ncbi:MAG: domain S-box protein [Holophagaceae bacterium]|nr:domain S-box protein [Holophagaceae bacterium]
MDVVRAVARVMGLQVRFQAAPFLQVREDLKHGRIHMVAGMLKTEERQRYADFSQPIHKIHYSIFIRRDSPAHDTVETLRGCQVLVERGSMIHEYFQGLGFRDELRPVASGPEAMRLLASGIGDAAVVTHFQGLTLLRSAGIQNVRVVGAPVLTRELCLATGKGQGDLLAKLDTGLAILNRTGESEAIYRRWFGELETKRFPARQLLWGALAVLGPILAALVGFLFWNRSLRRQVMERTWELTRTLGELRRSQGNLVEAQRLARLGSLEVDPGNREAYWSDELYRLLGYGAGDVPPLFETILERVHPDDRPRVQETVGRVFLSGEPQELEHRIRLSDGTERILLTHLSRTFPEGSASPKLIGTCQDITERRREEESLRQTQRLESLGVLAGGIAHDFNNLLAGIQGNLNLAQGLLSADHPAHAYLSTSEDTIQRAANLARQMLAYSGRGTTLVRPIQLNVLIQEMTELLKVTLSKNVEIRFSLAQDLPWVEADENQMQQVVMNLVTNAAEAIGDREGTITLSTRRARLDSGALREMHLDRPMPEGLYVIFEVVDTGCGMDAATQASMFDPFFTTKFSGRGLGLSAIKGILQGHGAGIRIQSVPGQGTQFCLCFPAADRVAPLEPAASSASMPVHRSTVLLAEDDVTVREATRELLESLGCSVLEAADGEEAVALFREMSSRISVVILDLTMPRMDGRQALQEIHSLCPGARVILTSGHHEEEAVGESEAAWIVGFLAKPYRFHQLEALLGQALAS